MCNSKLGAYYMKIAVVVLGYVGLTNAILLAQKHEVVGVDISQARVDMLNVSDVITYGSK